MDFYNYPHTDLNAQNQNWLIQQMKSLIAEYDKYENPVVVEYANQMTDTTKIYIYQGTEEGMNTTHWYFWYNDTWTDGGKWGTVDVTDEELQTAVNTWLNAHPEATTTVQDGSITVAKFAPGVITKTVAVTWEQGGLAWNGPTSRNDRIHMADYLPANVTRITATNGYVFAFAGYNAEKWLGYYAANGQFGGTSVWLTDLDVDSIRQQYPYYTFKFVGAKANTTDSITPTEGSNFTFIADELFEIVDNMIPHYVTPESFSLITTPIWKSSFGTVAVPQGLCYSGGYVWLCGQQQGGSDTAPSYILKLSKTGSVVASNTTDSFGHCSGIAVDDTRGIAYIAKWDSATNYSTLYKISTSTLTAISSTDMRPILGSLIPNYSGFVSCAYNAKYDKLIIAMRGTPHHFVVLNPDDLSVDRLFRYAEPAVGFTLQAIVSIDDMIYVSWCRGTMAEDNVENFVTAYDWEGHEVFTTSAPLNDELEGVAFDGISYYFAYQDFHTSGVYSPVYKASFKPRKVYKSDVVSKYVANYQ